MRHIRAVSVYYLHLYRSMPEHTLRDILREFVRSAGWNVFVTNYALEKAWIEKVKAR